MVTFAQAQERADRWVNGSAAIDPRREVRVREFDLGFVAWAEDAGGAPVSGGKLVIARDSGDTTLWPALPVAEVIRRYEEVYGTAPAAPAAAESAQRIDLNATSFLLTPPEWLQEAADRAAPGPAGRGDEPAGPVPSASPEGAPAAPAAPSAAGSDAPWNAPASGPAVAAAGADSPVPDGVGPTPPGSDSAAPGGAPWGAPGAGPGTPGSAPAGDGSGSTGPTPPGSDPATPGSAGDSPWAGRDTGPSAGGAAWPEAPGSASRGSSPWDANDTSGSGADAESVAPPMTVFSAPVNPGQDAPAAPSAGSEAKTTVMPQGSSLPKTAVHPSAQGQQPPPGPEGLGGAPMAPPPGAGAPPPGPPGAGGGPSPLPPPIPGGGASDLASADTARAEGPIKPAGGAGAPVPPPPGAPGAPGGGGDAGAAGGYIPTQMVDIDDFRAQAGIPAPPSAPGAPGGGAGTPPAAPGTPGAPAGGEMHGAATVFAAQAPASPGAPAQPGAPGAPPGAAPGGPPSAAPGAGTGYGYPQSGQPTVGSGYMAVLRYRAPDGSEQQLIRRSAPGMPHPEWQILYELRGMNVPPQAVLELHTELQSCELPGGYCARMVRETWPTVRITHTAPYGRDLGSRQAGVRHLVEHQDELQQFADGPPRATPVRAPLPQQQPAPAIGLDVIGQELADAYGPQGVFRYEPQAASRQGVPEIVTQTLIWAGLPREINPFFWAFAQPGRPVPTLAEVAAERGIPSAPDAGSYLVMGSDFGRQLCVQYGTACIVAVPLELGPGGQAEPPQFVNASLPQFARCMALLGRMWRLRYGLSPDQAGRWTTDFQAELAALDPQAVADPESWWSVLLEQMWDGLL
ncbi:SUKH-4 family immunity protein [Streptomyces sp. B6B3]|uniref:SUKH-4 family immunity protein n=1 Tax=Streptomyces sp. B6B3 TaxID=3153570 RepID=UPI00325CCAF7